MSKSYGGKQHAIRQSIIKQEHGYLGTYEHTLEPGDTQTMIFQASDSRPFWMTEQQREETRKDRVQQGEIQKKKICKAKLIKMLQDHGITAMGNIDNIQKLATSRGIPVEEEIPKVIEGWEGKPKGMMQVLWE